MRPVDYPDRHYLQAAAGWLELGDSAEAARELRHISREAAGHPDVLELRWRLYAAQDAWDAALDVARAVTKAAPDRPSGWIHQSYCLHELKRTDEAWELLGPLARRFPDEFVIPYNLACYACALGEMQAAREWFQRAVKIKGKEELKRMALEDPDLLPLREYITAL